MRIQPINPVHALYLDERKRERPDAPKLTMERVIEQCKEVDPSFVVDLSKKDIPSFLYNSSGKLT